MRERAGQLQDLMAQREALQHEQHALQTATQSLAQKSDSAQARLWEEQQLAKRAVDKMLAEVALLEQRRDEVSKRFITSVLLLLPVL